MTDRPILFSAPMVRALLAGTKTQTRRVVKPQPTGLLGQLPADSARPEKWWFSGGPPPFASFERACPYGVPGDRLWVRETWRPVHSGDPSQGAQYRADKPDVWNDVTRWRPAIHMFRWASRLTLTITDVRVERLNDISEADADAECFGGDFPERVLPEVFPAREGGWGHLSIVECYARLWEHINGPGSWAANPWVWAVSFEVER